MRIHILIIIMINNSSEHLPTGILYAVPYPWWKQYSNTPHKSMSEFSDLQYIDSTSIIDTLIIDFEEDIVNEITEKSNNLNFVNRVLSAPLLPDLRFGQHYALLSPLEWRRLAAENYTRHPVIVFAFENYQPESNEKVEIVKGVKCVPGQQQVQLILCTNRASELFIGYLPQNIKVVDAIRLILQEMNLVEMPETKIVFLEQDKESAQSLDKIANKTVKQLKHHQTLMMVINLFGFEEECRSDQAINGDHERRHANLDDAIIIDHKTLSTGASTPMTFSHSDQRNDFQVLEMFREKTKEEIQQMKQLARSAINGEQIELDLTCNEEDMKQQLLLIREQILENLSTHKKKGSKDKQI